MKTKLQGFNLALVMPWYAFNLAMISMIFIVLAAIAAESLLSVCWYCTLYSISRPEMYFLDLKGLQQFLGILYSGPWPRFPLYTSRCRAKGNSWALNLGPLRQVLSLRLELGPVSFGRAAGSQGRNGPCVLVP